jgi:hypothetical protein
MTDPEAAQPMIEEEEKEAQKTYRHSEKVTNPSLFLSMSLKNSANLALDTVKPALRKAA